MVHQEMPFITDIQSYLQVAGIATLTELDVPMLLDVQHSARSADLTQFYLSSPPERFEQAKRVYQDLLETLKKLSKDMDARQQQRQKDAQPLDRFVAFNPKHLQVSISL